jgi:hypothetical protein
LSAMGQGWFASSMGSNRSTCRIRRCLIAVSFPRYKRGGG